jgi:hypothetical protein
METDQFIRLTSLKGCLSCFELTTEAQYYSTKDEGAGQDDSRGAPSICGLVVLYLLFAFVLILLVIFILSSQPR